MLNSFLLCCLQYFLFGFSALLVVALVFAIVTLAVKTVMENVYQSIAAPAVDVQRSRNLANWLHVPCGLLKSGARYDC